jgi:hypothetical protein
MNCVLRHLRAFTIARNGTLGRARGRDLEAERLGEKGGARALLTLQIMGAKANAVQLSVLGTTGGSLWGQKTMTIQRDRFDK